MHSFTFFYLYIQYFAALNSQMFKQNIFFHIRMCAYIVARLQTVKGKEITTVERDTT